jgi:predicted HicB family RNase H-like nuclease
MSPMKQKKIKKPKKIKYAFSVRLEKDLADFVAVESDKKKISYTSYIKTLVMRALDERLGL